MDGIWTVTIDFPDGERQRKILLPDLLVQHFRGRPGLADKDKTDQVTVLRLAESEVLRRG